MCKGLLKAGKNWGCGRRFARADALGRHFRSEAGRVCIRPLLDEETAERAQRGLVHGAGMEMHAKPPPGGMAPGIDAVTMGMAFPSALLEQYPALAGVNWSQMSGQGEEEYDDLSAHEFEDAESAGSRLGSHRNSYDGSAMGSQRNSYDGSGWGSDTGELGYAQR